MRNINKNQNHSLRGFTQLEYSAGFTLVETLVAITVLLLVIIGPITIAQKGIQNAYFANEQVTATMLAQEAVETVRMLRDEDALDAFDHEPGGDTENWMPSGCSVACAFDEDDQTFHACSGGSCGKLEIDQNSGKYVFDVFDGGSEGIEAIQSPFTRSITIGSAVNGGVPVTVDVTWNASTFGGVTRTVKLQTWVYNHYQRYEE